MRVENRRSGAVKNLVELRQQRDGMLREYQSKIKNLEEYITDDEYSKESLLNRVQNEIQLYTTGEGTENELLAALSGALYGSCIRARVIRDKGYAESMALHSDRIKGYLYPEEWPVNGLALWTNNVTVIAGFPGTGKTRSTINILLRSIIRGERVLFFSLEMTEAQILCTMAAQYLYHTDQESKSTFWISRNWQDERVKGFIELAEKNLEIVDATRLKASDIMGLYHLLKERNHTHYEIVAIDYLQRIKPDIKSSEYQQLSDSMMTITQGAKYSDSAWILVSQQNRSSYREDKNDHASLKGSGAIEEDAAVVAILGKPKDGAIPINWSKVRYGPVQDWSLKIDMRTGYIGPEYEKSGMM